MPRATVCMKERAAGRTGMLGLAGLRAGQPVRCTLAHRDGRIRTPALRHSCSEAQFAWFRAGSALNCLDASSRA